MQEQSKEPNNNLLGRIKSCALEMIRLYQSGRGKDAVEKAEDFSRIENGSVSASDILAIALRNRDFQGVKTPHLNPHFVGGAFAERYDAAAIGLGLLGSTPENPISADTMRMRVYNAYNFARLAIGATGVAHMLYCGVSYGLTPYVVMSLLRDCEGINSEATLVDCWTGQKTLSISQKIPGYCNDMEKVKLIFSEFDNVHFVRGFMADSVSRKVSEDVSFVYLNTGDIESERKFLMDHYDGMRAGAIIIHGTMAHSRRGLGSDFDLFEALGVCPFVLPTGQVVLQKL